MSIQPPSDILLDVVKAADPHKAQAMAARLREVASAGPAGAVDLAEGAGFDDALASEGVAAPALGEGTSPLGGFSARALSNATALSARQETPGASPYRRFEAMVLSGFVEQLLPKSSATLFGAGTAGQVWRSMLAERIADEVAKSGGIGIAQHLAAARGGPSAS
jgi:hypothetical protein